jgi:hypothetical protein
MIEGLLTALASYLGLGLVFAILFVIRGVGRIDPHAAHGSWGFRILILPGTVLLWPILARRWLSRAQQLPEERNSHRSAPPPAAKRFV